MWVTAHGFVPPPYPYDRLNELRLIADSVQPGCIDCSVGTPFEPMPEVARNAAIAGLAKGQTYPPSIGELDFRSAAADWMRRRLAVECDPNAVAAGIGAKELVAGIPHWLKLRRPNKTVVLHPAVSYPSYAMGAELAGCRAVGVPADDEWHLDLDQISDQDADDALMLWINEPGNPSGSSADAAWMARCVAWAQERDILLVSDECYIEFCFPPHGTPLSADGAWPAGPSAMAAGIDGVLSVHSLSKRSNLAGMRAAFYAGDPAIVGYLSEVRKHAGMMTPYPTQRAATAALADDAHVNTQRALYFERRSLLLDALNETPLHHCGGDATFYLWVRSDVGSDGWTVARRFAELGVLVSPGEFYGDQGASMVRIALVQPIELLEIVAERLANW